MSVKADAALDRARGLCGAIADLEDQLSAKRAERRTAWVVAQDAGVTRDEIAAACGMSLASVKAELALARGATWPRR